MYCYATIYYDIDPRSKLKSAEMKANSGSVLEFFIERKQSRSIETITNVPTQLQSRNENVGGCWTRRSLRRYERAGYPMQEVQGGTGSCLERGGR